MTIKILFVNSNLYFGVREFNKDISISNATFQLLPTLHDFHVIFIDTDSIFDPSFWTKLKPFNKNDAKSRIFEQVSSGGVIFCFCSSQSFLERKILEQTVIGDEVKTGYLSNYFFTPPGLSIEYEAGDTFTLDYAELRYFNPLFKNNKIPLTDITWRCHFTSLPKDTRILGKNRAGYPVFIEIPLGSGKIIMLPYFREKSIVVNTIIKEILPQIFKEENIEYLLPDWLKDYDIPIEQELRDKLSKIQNTKKLLYTQSKPLEKSVELAFSLLDFDVKRLKQGSHADILISDDDFKALIEVKGHNNRQAKKAELIQLYAAIEELPESDDIKGIFFVNHEFEKKPEDRSKEGFTQDAIHFAESVGISLISSLDLYEVVMGIIQNNINEEDKNIIRDKIKNCSGIVKFSNDKNV